MNKRKKRYWNDKNGLSVFIILLFYYIYYIFFSWFGVGGGGWVVVLVYFGFGWIQYFLRFFFMNYGIFIHYYVRSD